MEKSEGSSYFGSQSSKIVTNKVAVLRMQKLNCGNAPWIKKLRTDDVYRVNWGWLSKCCTFLYLHLEMGHIFHSTCANGASYMMSLNASNHESAHIWYIHLFNSSPLIISMNIMLRCQDKCTEGKRRIRKIGFVVLHFYASTPLQFYTFIFSEFYTFTLLHIHTEHLRKKRFWSFLSFSQLLKHPQIKWTTFFNSTSHELLSLAISPVFCCTSIGLKANLLKLLVMYMAVYSERQYFSPNSS